MIPGSAVESYHVGYRVGNTCVPSKHLSHCNVFQPGPQLRLTVKTVTFIVVFPLFTKAGGLVDHINTLGVTRALPTLTWTTVACNKIERFKTHFETNNTQIQAPNFDGFLVSILSFWVSF